MDPITQQILFGAAGAGGFDFFDANNIGEPVEGGFFVGLISQSANGTATHALIVAPEATGATGNTYSTGTMLQLSGNTRSGSGSLYDGAANTAALVAVGSPAAEFCNNLTIDGYSDWYLPALKEIEIAYFHLRPFTNTNNTTYGANLYAVPARSSNYTANNPPQTSVTAFRNTGGNRSNEEFQFGNDHWTSTFLSNTNSQIAYQKSFGGGAEHDVYSNSTNCTRAFRKVAV